MGWKYADAEEARIAKNARRQAIKRERGITALTLAEVQARVVRLNCYHCGKLFRWHRGGARGNRPTPVPDACCSWACRKAMYAARRRGVRRIETVKNV